MAIHPEHDPEKWAPVFRKDHAPLHCKKRAFAEPNWIPARNSTNPVFSRIDGLNGWIRMAAFIQLYLQSPGCRFDAGLLRWAARNHAAKKI